MTEHPERLFAPPDASDDASEFVEEIIGDFFRSSNVSTDIDPESLAELFLRSEMPAEGMSVEAYLDYLCKRVVAHSVKMFSPRSMAHMTSAVPLFSRYIGAIMLAMNQNLLKADASKALTHHERETLAMLHRLIFGLPEAFYREHVQAADSTLGIMVSGGTLGNITALWLARNARLGPKNGFAGIARAGLAAGLEAHGYRGATVIGSRLMHYSFEKAADLLGIGADGLVKVPVDRRFRVDLDGIRRAVDEATKARRCILAIVGIAGTTDAGTIDALAELGSIAREVGARFHVDAAWGGPLLFSETHRVKLRGIELADSVGLDGHKRFHLPTGVGMLVLRDPGYASAIEKSAPYLIREGSPDLGKRALEGSRPGTALFVHAALHIFGRSGYASLVEHGLELTHYMAARIGEHPEFELLVEPELHVLLYRYVPRRYRGAATGEAARKAIDAFNVRLYAAQVAAGRTLVSRTTIPTAAYGDVVALRAVIANPLTDRTHVDEVLAEQLEIGDAIDTNATEPHMSAREIYDTWNETQVPYAEDRCVHQLFEEQVERTPDAIALRLERGTVTYRALEDRANAFALHLAQRGVGAGGLVGICLDRGLDAVTALLAAFKLGAAYVYLDPRHPPAYLGELVASSGAHIVVTAGDAISRFAREIVLAIDAVSWPGEPPPKPTPTVRLDDRAFLLYTSGSTGKAKGIQGTHRAIANRLATEPVPFTAEDVLCHKSSLGFIDSIWEIFAPLTRGLSTAVVPTPMLLEPEVLVAFFNAHAVTRIVLVPSFLRWLLENVESLGSALPTVRYYTSSGEPLTSSLAARFREAAPEATLLNIYGLTETWDATCHAVEAVTDAAYVPIGKAMGNVRVYLVDEAMSLVDLGTAGEICIAGAGLGLGYLNEPELTARKFVDNPFGPGRLFRTGDFAMATADGTFAFVGRQDHQVKIGGFRIELGQVEAALAQHPALSHVAVAAFDERETASLVGYFVAKGPPPAGKDLRKFMRARLPDYMVPTVFVVLDEMPMTTSGKIARRSLPRPSLAKRV